MSSCKELISIFGKIGGKFVCNYDTRDCTLLPQNINAKFTKDDKEDLGYLISQYAYSGQYNDFVTLIPESEESKKSPFLRELAHRYQEKKTSGFIIEYHVDKDGFQIPKSKNVKK
jgi:hypothetical protein